jgi:hypothetical protein
MTKRKIRIYVAGPYSTGDPVTNTKRAIDAGNVLLDAGFIPFIPHLTMFWHLMHPHEYETWLAYDFEWLDTCDAFLRLPGESSGADREQQRFIARNGASRVYLSLETLLACERV